MEKLKEKTKITTTHQHLDYYYYFFFLHGNPIYKCSTITLDSKLFEQNQTLRQEKTINIQSL